MRQVTFQRRLAGEDQEKWLLRCFEQIANASLDDALMIADDLSVTNFTATRTLNAGTATLGDLANFVATFVDDLQRRGKNRTQ